MGFSRQEYWSGLPFPSPGDLPDPGIKPESPALEADALTLSHQGRYMILCDLYENSRIVTLSINDNTRKEFYLIKNLKMIFWYIISASGSQCILDDNKTI